LSVDSTTDLLRRLSIPSLEQRNSQLSFLENIAQNQQQDAHNEMLQSSSFGGDIQTSALRRRKNSIVNIVSSTKVEDEDDSNVSNVS
jgi:alpha/beta superfamily hydrolase